MKNVIETKNGNFTIKNCGKEFKIEQFEFNENLGYADILGVVFSSNFNLKDEEVDKLFKEYEHEVIKILKFHVEENIEFYNHFDFNIDSFLDGNYSINLNPLDPFGKGYKRSWEIDIRAELIGGSLN